MRESDRLDPLAAAARRQADARRGRRQDATSRRIGVLLLVTFAAAVVFLLGVACYAAFTAVT